MKSNKWGFHIKNQYTVGNETITRIDMQAIPPTKGDRIDIIGTSGKYYFGMSKEKWFARIPKEEMLKKSSFKNDKEKKEILAGIDWTPRKIKDEIEIIIKIKKGKITLGHKL